MHNGPPVARSQHPWFNVGTLGASERSSGAVYGKIVNWQQGSTVPEGAAGAVVASCDPKHFTGCDLVFSALVCNSSHCLYICHHQRVVCVLAFICLLPVRFPLSTLCLYFCLNQRVDASHSCCVWAFINPLSVCLISSHSFSPCMPCIRSSTICVVAVQHRHSTVRNVNCFPFRLVCRKQQCVSPSLTSSLRLSCTSHFVLLRAACP